MSNYGDIMAHLASIIEQDITAALDLESAQTRNAIEDLVHDIVNRAIAEQLEHDVRKAVYQVMGLDT